MIGMATSNYDDGYYGQFIQLFELTEKMSGHGFGEGDHSLQGTGEKYGPVSDEYFYKYHTAYVVSDYVNYSTWMGYLAKLNSDRDVFIGYDSVYGTIGVALIRLKLVPEHQLLCNRIILIIAFETVSICQLILQL
jgi:hypothetical protein